MIISSEKDQDFLARDEIGERAIDIEMKNRLVLSGIYC